MDDKSRTCLCVQYAMASMEGIRRKIVGGQTMLGSKCDPGRLTNRHRILFAITRLSPIPHGHPNNGNRLQPMLKHKPAEIKRETVLN